MTAKQKPETISMIDRQDNVAAWFQSLRDRICAEFERIESELTGTRHAGLPAGRFERKKWDRRNEGRAGLF